MKKLLVAALTLCGVNAAQASDFKQFRDWYAACDNLRNCSAYGFDAEFLGGGLSYLRIERGGAPEAPVKVTITVDVPRGAKFTLRFDDPALPGLPKEPQTGEEYDGSDDGRRVAIPGSEALIDALRKAQKIVITRDNPPGRALKDDEKTSTISMSGAAAALLWIDDQQKRLDQILDDMQKRQASGNNRQNGGQNARGGGGNRGGGTAAEREERSKRRIENTSTPSSVSGPRNERKRCSLHVIDQNYRLTGI